MWRLLGFGSSNFFPLLVLGTRANSHEHDFGLKNTLCFIEISFSWSLVSCDHLTSWYFVFKNNLFNQEHAEQTVINYD